MKIDRRGFLRGGAQEAVEIVFALASADEADRDNVPALAGILSLYGAPPRAEFVIPLDAAVAAGAPAGLTIVFRPVSGLEVEGEPVPPDVRVPVRIGAISLETERAVSAD